ncbi:Conserved oligomeric Golgi complex subunit 7 [Gigaspora margarita]|uniref:Conserved oligomeric Golgi complex subunit 7 n=1 Tax=Gigaspora margarita TaxID=4874 RepID=A0A8H4AE92_GIGMA|nr:Conserved oligomeric Golgi complex subunit 7 [Gigaspora margarita]
MSTSQIIQNGGNKSPSLAVPISTTLSPTSGNSIDFSSFLAKEFDVKSWINNTLSNTNLLNTSPISNSSNPISTSDIDETIKSDIKSTQDISSINELQSLENHSSALVEKIQFLNQEISLRLEKIIDDAVKGIPNIMSDLQIMSQDVINLKQSVLHVKSNLSTIDENSGKALERLKYLDLVKSRMESSRDLLREAENWNNLEAEASTIFASQDYQKASMRLQDAEKSLVIFQNTPEYEERRKLLTELQNQLEATISPQLVAALSQHDTSACQKFYIIFSQIGRKKEFCNYYYGSRKAPLVKMWQNASLIETDQSQITQLSNSTTTSVVSSVNIITSTSSNFHDQQSLSPKSPSQHQFRKKFVDFLKDFLQELFVVLNEEYTWCGNVFPDNNETLIALIENIFNSLKPSLGSRLVMLVNYYNEQCLPEIINAFMITENFGRQMERVLFNPIQIGSSASRISTFSGTKPFSKGNLISWGNVIFEPFSEYQHDYSEFEKNFLISELKRILQIKRDSSSIDLARIMAENIGKIFSMADDGLQRCMTLTHGFAGIGLVEALNYYFTSFVKEYHHLLDKLRIDCGLNDVNSKHETISQKKFHSSTSNDYFDFDQDKLQQEDWSNFQIGLRLLATCKLAFDKLNLFEETLRTTLVSVKELIEQDLGNEDLEWYERRSSPSINDSMGLSSIGTQSSILLLKQSLLNSYQLVSLLPNIESKSNDLKLLFPAQKSMETFIRQSQRFVFDTIFLPIVKHLSNLPIMEIWSAAAEPVQVSPFNLEIPTFSLSPSEYITRIGEHLLTLPQQFEVYADDESLAFSIKSLPFCDEVESKDENIGVGGKKDESTLSSTQGPETNETSSKASVLSSIKIVSESTVSLVDPSIIQQPQSTVEDISTEEVTHAWITSVARGTMHALFERILVIPQLSSHGTQQLLTDLGYLTNVLSALEIEPTREIIKTIKVLEMDEDSVVNALRVKTGSISSQSGSLMGDFEEFSDVKDSEILDKVASVRGIKLLDLGF